MRVLAMVVMMVGCAQAPFEAGDSVPRPDEVPVEHAPDADPEAREAVEALLLDFMRREGPPGLAVGLVRDGEVLYSGGFGWADLERERPLGANTPVLLSSVSKTFVGVAAMQAVEAGTLQLTDPVGPALRFEMDAPHAGDAPITFRHLLTHHSGVRDTVEYGRAYDVGDPVVALGDFLASYLVRGGDRWRAGSFARHEPGAQFSYSNVGMALAGYALGESARVPFSDVVQRDILEPLGMNDSGYYLSDLTEVPAVPYGRDGTEAFAPYPQYGYPTYPDGMLRSSAHDMARYVAAMAGGGILDETRVLPAEAVAQMVQVDPELGTDEDGQAIAWAMRELEGRPLIGHNGSDYGSFAELWFDPDTGDGFVVLLNGFPSTPFADLIALEAELLAIAEG